MTGRLARELKQGKAFPTRSLEAYLNLMRTADRLSQVASELLKPFDLSGSTYNVLRILRGAGEGGLPSGEIGNRLLTHHPDVTRLVDRLEERGLAERRRDARDRRLVLVVITVAGLRLLEECDMDRRLAEAHQPFFACLDPGQIDTLTTLLEALRGPDETSPERTTP